MFVIFFPATSKLGVSMSEIWIWSVPSLNGKIEVWKSFYKNKRSMAANWDNFLENVHHGQVFKVFLHIFFLKDVGSSDSKGIFHSYCLASSPLMYMNNI